MKRSLKILALFLALQFLLATNGILIFHHICNICHTEDVSFFFPEHHNHHNKIKNHCCSGHKCEHNKDIDDSVHCCENSAIFLRINEPYNTENIIENIDINVAGIIIFDDSINDNQYELSTYLTYYIFNYTRDNPTFLINQNFRL